MPVGYNRGPGVQDKTLMDLFYGLSRGSSDPTARIARSDSSRLMDVSIGRRRLSSPSPSAFLVPAFNACASKSTSPLDLDPSLLRFTRSSSRPRASSDSPDSGSTRGRLRQLLQLRSPLRSVENIPRTPVKVVGVEGDVLVMDGVLVSDAAGSTTRGKPGSGESGSSGGNNNSFYKTDLCRSWEDTRLCRYGSKCQFAHGKEELRGPRPVRPKSEAGKFASTSGSGACGAKFRSHLPLDASAAVPVTGRTTASYAALQPEATIMTAEEAPAQTSPPPSELSTTFAWPPTEEDDAYFTRVLYGPSTRRRLPVFVDICSE